MNSVENPDDQSWMLSALALAKLGEGSVEPNPMVGCIVVRENVEIGRGWHQKFGENHAEVNALQQAGSNAAGSTLYVTLEPCVHFGKTPPCVDAIIKAKVARVVVACLDPFEKVNGQGANILRQAGIEVTVGVCQRETEDLNRPFFKLVQQSCPWVIAKWAMSLDGKIATVTGESKWISGEQSRAHAHQTRGRMDAIIVGRRTVEVDDPVLTARPPGPRTAVRVVVDSKCKTPIDSLLVKTASQNPTLIAVGPEAPKNRIEQIQGLGLEVWISQNSDRSQRLLELIRELGRRQMSNVLVEGGGELLGDFSTLDLIDETHVYIAPKIIGGQSAASPVAGKGIKSLSDCQSLTLRSLQQMGEDVLVIARRP